MFVSSGVADLQQILSEIHYVTQVMSLGLNLGLYMPAIEKIQTEHKLWMSRRPTFSLLGCNGRT